MMTSMLRAALLAAALFATSLPLDLSPAYAKDCSHGNGDGCTDPAPLPPAGIPTLLALGAGAVAIIMIRRRKVMAQKVMD
jgi:hypothetical protein